MTLRLGDKVPDFTQDSTEGPIQLRDWQGDKWVILFSHPADFTPVCTTELGMVAHLKPEFEKRNVKVIGLSVDPVESHANWARDIQETQGVALNFPLLADADRKVAQLYGMLHAESNGTATVRSVWVIDPKGVLRLTLTYPASTGRNFSEILRVIDSLQLTDSAKVATPVNWQRGDEVVILPRHLERRRGQALPSGLPPGEALPAPDEARELAVARERRRRQARQWLYGIAVRATLPVKESPSWHSNLLPR